MSISEAATEYFANDFPKDFSVIQLGNNHYTGSKTNRNGKKLYTN